MQEGNSNEPKLAEAKPHTVSSQPGRRARWSANFQMPKFKKTKSLNRRWLPALVALALIIVAGVSGFAGAWIQTRNSDTFSVTSGDLSSQKKIVTSQSQLISQIAKDVGPSVVSINVSVTSAAANTFDSFFGAGGTQEAQAAGTGVIISKSGIVMTNRHVVPEGTTKVSVILSDGTELKDVSVIDRTTSSDSLDVAFLKINDSEGHSLTPASLGNSAAVQVGDAVVAIGNALGQFQNTVTSGIISGYGRSVQASSSAGASDSENLDNLFQTDAAINAGNSGGPLVNMNGQVIGINTAVASDSENIGFAIPINDIKGLIKQIVDTGKISRSYLGVYYVPLTSDIANEYKLSVSTGAFIPPNSDTGSVSVIVDSPAAKAGIKENDVITEVSGIKIDQGHSLTSLLGRYQPGDKVTLTIVRDGKIQRVSVTLGTLPKSGQQ